MSEEINNTFSETIKEAVEETRAFNDEELSLTERFQKAIDEVKKKFESGTLEIHEIKLDEKNNLTTHTLNLIARDMLANLEENHELSTLKQTQVLCLALFEVLKHEPNKNRKTAKKAFMQMFDNVIEKEEEEEEEA